MLLPTAQVTEAIQARYLTRRFAVECIAGVTTSIWYDWKDATDALPFDGESHYGTTHAEYQNASQPFAPKPAFTAAATVWC
jgi:hypothetical protein